MSKPLLAATVLTLASLITSPALARVYPGISGITATADSAQTAGGNPAGAARFSERAFDLELMLFSSDSEWESEISGFEGKITTKDSGETVVPRIALIQPITDRINFAFTILGASFSDDFGDWPARYFITSYDSLLISAFPSLSYRINDQWSVAGSLALSYSSFEQERAVANILDPGFPDGRSEIETDSFEIGFGASTLYQQSDRTRWGLTYQSEIQPEQEGDNELSGLGPNTEALMDRLGLIGAEITVESTTPESVVVGVYHEFSNAHALTADLAWINFSNFRLSEFYFNGEAFVETEADYKDIYGIATSYTFPVADRWRLGVSALATNEMIDDDERTSTLRLDALWSVGVGAEWQWTESRDLRIALSYLRVGDAPVETAEAPIVGSVSGRYKSRDTWLLQIGTSFGGL